MPVLSRFHPTDITVPNMYTITTNGSDLHRSYLNGDLKVTNGLVISRTQTPSPQDWMIGKDDLGGHTTRVGDGNVYLVLRYNRELSSQEVAQVFEATRDRFGV